MSGFLGGVPRVPHQEAREVPALRLEVPLGKDHLVVHRAIEEALHLCDRFLVLLLAVLLSLLQLFLLDLEGLVILLDGGVEVQQAEGHEGQKAGQQRAARRNAQFHGSLSKHYHQQAGCVRRFD